MKWFAYILLFFIASSFSFQSTPSTWTSYEKKQASTTINSPYLTPTEKEVIFYLNLARLYPKKFAEVEVKNYYLNNNLKNSKYKKSLLLELARIKSTHPLIPKKELSENAKCFQVEQGKKGGFGHKRKNCEKRNYAECCAYGSPTGREVAIDLLIDENVNDLGHRKICLDKQYQFIGVAHGKHKSYITSTVLEFY